jgi:hypothetical protein
MSNTTRRPAHSAEALATVASYVRNVAIAEHAKYPQYAGYWNGPEWTVVRITGNVRTKMGVAFAKGELTIARRDDIYPDSWMAYSVRNRINTLVPARRVEAL